MNTAADTVHVPCAHCGATNRIPAARLAEDPVCGRCGAALLDGRPIELTDADFDRVAGRSDLPVVVDFWAPWCGPCRAVAPVLEEIANDQDGKLKIVKLNTDENPEVTRRYGITSIPTMHVVVGGEIVKTLVGAMPKPKLLRELEPFLG